MRLRRRDEPLTFTQELAGYAGVALAIFLILYSMGHSLNAMAQGEQVPVLKSQDPNVRLELVQESEGLLFDSMGCVNVDGEIGKLMAREDGYACTFSLYP